MTGLYKALSLVFQMIKETLLLICIKFKLPSYQGHKDSRACIAKKKECSQNWLANLKSILRLIRPSIKKIRRPKEKMQRQVPQQNLSIVLFHYYCHLAHHHQNKRMDRKFKQIANRIFAPRHQCLHENQKHANEQSHFKTLKKNIHNLLFKIWVFYSWPTVSV